MKGNRTLTTTAFIVLAALWLIGIYFVTDMGSRVEAQGGTGGTGLSGASGASGASGPTGSTPTLQITTTSLPAGSVGVPYSQQILSNGNASSTWAISGSLPPGLKSTPQGATLTIQGTPTAGGNYGFVVALSDAFSGTTISNATGSFTISITEPDLLISPLALTFRAITGGPNPDAQLIAIQSTNSTAQGWTAVIDNGTPGTAVPWLQMSPLSGAAPETAQVTFLPSKGSGNATIRFTETGNSAAGEIDVQVTATISTMPPAISAVPGSIQIVAFQGQPQTVQETVVVTSSGGGGAQSVSNTILDNSPWAGINPASAQASTSGTAFTLTANTAGLPLGLSHDVLQISGPNTLQIPVDVLVLPGPSLGVSQSGETFVGRVGSGSVQSQTIQIQSLGAPGTTLDWNAQFLSGGSYFNLSATSGTVAAGSPTPLTITPAPSDASLPAGVEYALLEITSSNAANLATQYVELVYVNQPPTASPIPQTSVAGLYFSGTATMTGTFKLLTDSSTPTSYQTSAQTSNGGSWLAVSPASGVVSTSQPATITATLTPPSAPGIYYAYLNISLGGTLIQLNVTLVVPGPVVTPLSRPLTTAAACTPGQIAITETGLANNFSIPAGWPATLAVQLNDNCGNPVKGASVIASFNTGDPPLMLTGDPATNLYSATWQPSAVFPGMTISLQATAGSLPMATELLTGSIGANPQAPPSLLPNGTLNIFFNGADATAAGFALAPGTVAQVYGANLGPSSVFGASVIPLPSTLDGTFMLVGSEQAPLFFVYSSPIAAQIPADLVPNQQYSSIASVNGALSLPTTLTVVPYQPAIAVNPDGSANAQHLNYTAVTASSPASPGETITLYLAGMGATNPAVPSGNATPLQLVPSTVQPTVTIDSQNAAIVYAGLTPTGIGLYQIDFTVPSNARSGNLNVVVTQNGVASNAATLPVSN